MIKRNYLGILFGLLICNIFPFLYAMEQKTFSWDTATKDDAKRIFSSKSPSADDLENIFCAVHVTGLNPCSRNFTLIPGALEHPFGSKNSSPFARLDNMSFRPFIYFTLGTVVDDHEGGKWSHKKYAIVTPFCNIVKRALNISPLDTAILGEIDLKDMPGTVIFLPENQLQTFKGSLPSGITFIPYSEINEILSTIRSYIHSKQHMVLRQEEGHFTFGLKIFIEDKNIYNATFFKNLLKRYPQASFGQEGTPKLSKGMINFHFLQDIISSANNYYVNQGKYHLKSTFDFKKAFHLRPLVICTEFALENCERLVNEFLSHNSESSDPKQIKQLDLARNTYERQKENIRKILKIMKIDLQSRILFQLRATDIGKFIGPDKIDEYINFETGEKMDWENEENVIKFLRDVSTWYSNVNMDENIHKKSEKGLFPFQIVLELLAHCPFKEVKRILQHECFFSYELELRTAIAFQQYLRGIYGQNPIDDTDLINELRVCYEQLRQKYFISSSNSPFYYKRADTKALTFVSSEKYEYIKLGYGSIGLVMLYKTLSQSFSPKRYTKYEADQVKLFLDKTGFVYLLTMFNEVGFITNNSKNYKGFDVKATLQMVLNEDGTSFFPEKSWEKATSYIIMADTPDNPF